MKGMAERYTQKYPSIARYGRDWMNCPDLKKLNDDYMREHDPVKFLRGAAQSRNFARLIAAYATDPAVQSFVREGIAAAPPEVAAKATDVLHEDGLVKGLVNNVVSALGLPPALIAGVLGGGKVDEKQVLGQILQGNPGLQTPAQEQGAAPSPSR